MGIYDTNMFVMLVNYYRGAIWGHNKRLVYQESIVYAYIRMRELTVWIDYKSCSSR